MLFVSPASTYGGDDPDAHAVLTSIAPTTSSRPAPLRFIAVGTAGLIGSPASTSPLSSRVKPLLTRSRCPGIHGSPRPVSLARITFAAFFSPPVSLCFSAVRRGKLSRVAVTSCRCTF
ncbi:hypothetical protein SCHPADRAFT_746658 [Schizopora paradoxa]|uniref:Uncharacterized protein n=1 Tax=Schizopora paradoxa TaxID=27342 RepID=A0A0H2RIQ3_9AGAM|nr:hypothetical protein SCHPADRAFT_746658 [Schizopora paradoxa]